VRKEQDTNSKFTCELCSNKVSMLIKEYGTGRWLCYECHYRKGISKSVKETLPERNNKNV